MGLRPRTARRLALAGGIVFILVTGVVVAVTLPKFQNRRQIEAFERNGLTAHEAGRHAEAVQLLGRHIRGMGERPVEPETRLAFARSRAELEVADGGHLTAAIGVYREYLRERGEDRKASEELLELFIKTGQWVEARELSSRLRPAELGSARESDRRVLRNEALARFAINRNDPMIARIEDRLLELPSPEFADVWRAYTRAIGNEDLERAESLVARFEQGAPDSLGLAVVKAIVGVDGLSIEDAAAELARVLALDPITGASTGEVTLDDDELVRAMLLLFESWRQESLVIGVLRKAVAHSNDPDFGRMLARRLYWSGQGGEIAGLPRKTASGRPVVDIDGYAALHRLDTEPGRGVDELLAAVAAVTDDFRAQGWKRAIEARLHSAAGKLVDARTSATQAVERYPFEPTLRLILGDIHEQTGRFAEASESWQLATQLAGAGVWVTPEARRIQALIRNGRFAEAGLAADALMEVQRQSGLRRTVIESLLLQLQVRAQLAVVFQLDPAKAQESLTVARSLQNVGDESLTIDTLLAAAAMEGTLRNLDGARRDLAALVERPMSPSQMGRANEIDLAFGLDFFGAAQESVLRETTDPAAALRNLLAYIAVANPSDRPQRVDEVISFLGRAVSAATADQRAAWLRTDAVVRDQIGHPSAVQAWRAALAADPENIELLTSAVESESMITDRQFVEDTINRIVQLTGSQGRTLPSRLRLARARAIFGTVPTRQTRDEALVIVRAIVVSEPENVNARTVLGNMLQFACPPQVPAPNRFERDLAGAVDQYLAAAQLVGGPASLGYLLTAARLSSEAGNEARARQILSDLVIRARTSPMPRSILARELARLSDTQASARFLEELFTTAPAAERVDLGLFLTQAYIATNSTQRAVALLDQIVAGGGSMSRAQLTELVARYEQVGRSDRAQALLSDLSRFGLSPADAERMRAEQAIQARNFASAVSILTALAQSQPDDPSIWLTLIDAQFRTGDVAGAESSVEQALSRHPDHPDLTFWKQMVGGDPAAAVLGRFEGSNQAQGMRLAIERVRAYDSAKEGMSREARLTELGVLRDAFAANAAVQKYVLRERAELGDAPASMASDAIAAHRRFPQDEELLRFAAILSLQAGRHDDAMRFATSLRSLTLGPTTEADLIFSQAAQAVGNFQAIVDRLSTTIDRAISNPDDPQQLAVIYLYSTGMLRTGGEAGIRSRLEPLARRSAEFRANVWIPLAAGEVQQAVQAESWLRTAEQAGARGLEPQLVEGWIALSNRFPNRAQEFATNAVRLVLPQVAAMPDDFGLVLASARALQRQGETQDRSSASEVFAQAEEFFVRAGAMQPENPNHLFNAALCADAAGRPGAAERFYRRLLVDFSGNDLFTAAVRNNLAGVISRSDPTPERLREAQGLANDAIAFQRIGAFFGTRGWIRLALGDLANAEADFREIIQDDPAAVEGWLGLAAVASRAGDRPGDVEQAAGRLRSLISSTPLSGELQVKAEMYGVQW